VNLTSRIAACLTYLNASKRGDFSFPGEYEARIEKQKQILRSAQDDKYLFGYLSITCASFYVTANYETQLLQCDLTIQRPSLFSTMTVAPLPQRAPQ